MTNAINPTVSRAILYRPKDTTAPSEARCAAVVAKVNEDGTINIGVFNSFGVYENEQNIKIVGEGETPEHGQCEWMPHQYAQAGGVTDKVARFPEKEAPDEEAALGRLASRVATLEQYLAAEGIQINQPDKDNVVDIGAVEAGDTVESEIPVADGEAGLLYSPDEIENFAHSAYKAVKQYKANNGLIPPLEQQDSNWLLDQKARYIASTEHILENPTITPEDQHRTWMNYMLDTGHVYGEVEDAEKKTNPNLKPFDELPEVEQVKVTVIMGAVLRAAGIVPVDSEVDPNGGQEAVS